MTLQSLRERAVLIVEDDEALQFTAKRQLVALGVEADIANDGVEALAQLKNKRCCLILMDLQMLRMDGLEATRKIREREENDNLPYTPIVAMTAYPERERCFDAGMNDYLLKPVLVDALSRLIERWT
jgi:CheY-like chemotaxis protein